MIIWYLESSRVNTFFGLWPAPFSEWLFVLELWNLSYETLKPTFLVLFLFAFSPSPSSCFFYSANFRSSPFLLVYFRHVKPISMLILHFCDNRIAEFLSPQQNYIELNWCCSRWMAWRGERQSGGNKAIEKSELNDEIYDSWQESKEHRERARGLLGVNKRWAGEKETKPISIKEFNPYHLRIIRTLDTSFIQLGIDFE